MRRFRWLVIELGDWAVLASNAFASGGPFEFTNDANPDGDDIGFTMPRCGGCARSAPTRPSTTPASGPPGGCSCKQCDDGGWAAFEPLRWRLPSRAALAKIGSREAPSADVIEHVLEALAANGKAHSAEAWRGAGGCAATSTDLALRTCNGRTCPP